MKKIVAGIFAHVDAGKTTLSEAMLYISGTIRNHGRVDDGDTFLDTYELEKKRGITIFSKLARMEWKDLKLTLVDTPGHVDFSAEMERSIKVIDYAILVISGSEGVQAHTMTLWKLFRYYHKPVIIFVNKMDMPTASKTAVMHELVNKLSDGCVEFSGKTEGFQDGDLEKIASCDEGLMDRYLETGTLENEDIKAAVAQGITYPVFFGSALKMQGIEEFMDEMSYWIKEPEYSEEFSAYIYKIVREGNERLTFMKLTGGCLKVKTEIKEYQEKADQIRLYNGEKYESVKEAGAGEIVAVTGLTKSGYGDIIGDSLMDYEDMLMPVMSYTMYFEDGIDSSVVYRKIRELGEELPELSICWNEEKREIDINIMGKIQLEIIKNLILERYGIEANFGTGQIIYKETVAKPEEGVGHFEPLRHYAEVQLRIEPGERGSGIEIASECSEDELAKNWQRLIFTHIKERVHRGVLTGGELTDVRIILTGGRAHNKHTEGGDFRQATYRAIRQGLMRAENVLLEPYYSFDITVPKENLGKAMTDLGNMDAKFEVRKSNDTEAVITGKAPIRHMVEYPAEISAYTKGRGSIVFRFDGYDVCKDAEKIVEEKGYNPELDVRNTPDSVFCAHGAGYVVSWSEAPVYMHVPSKFYSKHEKVKETKEIQTEIREDKRDGYEKDAELKAIFERTYGSGNQDKSLSATRKVYGKYSAGSSDGTNNVSLNGKISKTDKEYVYKPVKRQDKYLLVDGYNVIFAWEELNSLARENMDAARDKLIEIMSNYQGYTKVNLMIIFDAYKVKGFKGEGQKINNVYVVFTKEAETADAFIEKFAHENGKKFDITVATSDGLEQIIITGEGCHLISSRELKTEVGRINEIIREHLEDNANKF